MAVIKILGIFDLIAAMLLIAQISFDINSRIILSLAIYLWMKWFLFKEDPASVIDLLIGIYCIFSYILGPVAILSLPCAIFLGQKGIFSLI